MVKKCCVYTCPSESYGGCNISFHSFPKNEEMQQKWLSSIHVKQKITKNSVVCSRHFEPSCFYSANSRLLLKTDAIPTIPPAKKKGKSNYTQIKMGLGQKLHPATETVSSSIHCQQDHSNRLCEASTLRPAFAKSPKADLIEECHKETQILPASNQYNNDGIVIEVL
ncbi:THAP domain-containing protein 1-like isoform X1 [Spodoptera litura]|uniref:THAP domain-containing protein 1-like isoform X1 n=1 Tax=Spodoptera litura TaxID=69820 RepID=A0A9J7DUS5_SPOLT|nr:THAP domain-containing protein 1-like isoform X1 [Spodoptera litura]